MRCGKKLFSYCHHIIMKNDFGDNNIWASFCKWHKA